MFKKGAVKKSKRQIYSEVLTTFRIKYIKTQSYTMAASCQAPEAVFLIEKRLKPGELLNRLKDLGNKGKII